MSTFLWESIAFGPIHSRRLGQSLGINLMPVDEKICTFNCLYCECGWTLEKNLNAREPYPLETVMEAIERKLSDCSLTTLPWTASPSLATANRPFILGLTKSLTGCSCCATNTIPMRSLPVCQMPRSFTVRKLSPPCNALRIRC